MNLYELHKDLWRIIYSVQQQNNMHFNEITNVIVIRFQGQNEIQSHFQTQKGAIKNAFQDFSPIHAVSHLQGEY